MAFENEPMTFDALSPGQDLGCSPWIRVDQAMISGFAKVTRDPDPMHIDPAWAAEHGPYGGTIAFGFLTVALLTHMLHGALGTDPQRDSGEYGHFLNYGMDRLRLLAPVTVDSRIRGHFSVAEKRSDDKGRNLAKFAVEVEIEGAERPALIAQWLAMWVPPDAR